MSFINHFSTLIYTLTQTGFVVETRFLHWKPSSNPIQC